MSTKPWQLPSLDGGTWHRDDFTESMLPVGYRPLLRDELPMQWDEILIVPPDRWVMQNRDQLSARADPVQCHQRTSRMLPSHVRYVREVALWRLPNPPAGHQWHVGDAFIQEDLEGGWRPLLVGEVEHPGCEDCDGLGWVPTTLPYGIVSIYPTKCRTKRPLPDVCVAVETLPVKKRIRALEI